MAQVTSSWLASEGGSYIMPNSRDALSESPLSAVKDRSSSPKVVSGTSRALDPRSTPRAESITESRVKEATLRITTRASAELVVNQ